MLNSATTLVERRTVLTAEYGTHPYEAGWASEALFFVRTNGEHPELTITPQVSPDGIDWVDHGPSITLAASEELAKLGMTHFGTWIRLHLSGASADESATIFVHLALKG
ncbi:hypothetical protein ASD65_08705 [Microbacterium sp. Root61]|uniref:DUF6385 domain-containing protein n=1 Tax=Microbacterium sp. Root61 TaxID=1736570 RepID=UPI0006F6DEFB|nr:DUF6385 domain-containing protein [Microbacterium sp. Root61]KRA24492.1 hypothetical protein ASD65_08705 [Microbacterium sp. Root61]